jgi:hypothetical protein
MPRDEEGRRRARNQARFALIVCVAMFAALTPVLAAMNVNVIGIAEAQPDPCEIIPDPPPDLCPPASASASVSASASASRSASASASASASSSASASTSPSTSASASRSPSASASQSPSATPSTSRPPSPSVSPSRTPQTFSSDTTVTINFKRRRSKFVGRVNSDFDECEAGRRMVLYKVVPGFGTGKKTGKGRSKANGTYSIRERRANGKYFVSAKPKQVTTTAGDTINCRKGRSKRVKA